MRSSCIQVRVALEYNDSGIVQKMINNCNLWSWASLSFYLFLNRCFFYLFYRSFLDLFGFYLGFNYRLLISSKLDHIYFFQFHEFIWFFFNGDLFFFFIKNKIFKVFFNFQPQIVEKALTWLDHHDACRRFYLKFISLTHCIYWLY